MVWRRIFGRTELTPVEARQGFLDRPVLTVLIVQHVSGLRGLWHRLADDVTCDLQVEKSITTLMSSGCGTNASCQRDSGTRREISPSSHVRFAFANARAAFS